MNRTMILRSLLVMAFFATTFYFQNAHAMQWIKQQQEKMQDAGQATLKKAEETIANKQKEMNQATENAQAAIIRRVADLKGVQKQPPVDQTTTKESSSFMDKIRSALSPVSEKVQQVKTLREANAEVSKTKADIKTLQSQTKDASKTLKSEQLNFLNTGKITPKYATAQTGFLNQRTALTAEQQRLKERQEVADNAKKALFSFGGRKKAEEPGTATTLNRANAAEQARAADSEIMRADTEKTNTARTTAVQETRVRSVQELLKEPTPERTTNQAIQTLQKPPSIKSTTSTRRSIKNLPKKITPADRANDARQEVKEYQLAAKKSRADADNASQNAQDARKNFDNEKKASDEMISHLQGLLKSGGSDVDKTSVNLMISDEQRKIKELERDVKFAEATARANEDNAKAISQDAKDAQKRLNDAEALAKKSTTPAAVFSQETQPLKKDDALTPVVPQYGMPLKIETPGPTQEQLNRASDEAIFKAPAGEVINPNKSIWDQSFY